MAIPTDFDGLVLWLNSDGIAAYEQDDVIPVWLDSSGQNSHALQNDIARQPIFQEDMQNGYPSVRFDSVDDYMGIAADFSGLTAGEIFAIVRVRNDPSPSVERSGLWHIGVDSQLTSYPSTDGIIYEQFGTTARKTVGNPGLSLTQFVIYNISSTDGEWVARLNGLEIYRTAINTAAFTDTPILGSGDGPAQFFNGDIMEVAMYDNILSSGNRLNLTVYFGDKFRIPVTLQPTPHLCTATTRDFTPTIWNGVNTGLYAKDLLATAWDGLNSGLAANSFTPTVWDGIDSGNYAKSLAASNSNGAEGSVRDLTSVSWDGVSSGSSVEDLSPVEWDGQCH